MCLNYEMKGQQQHYNKNDSHGRSDEFGYIVQGIEMLNHHHTSFSDQTGCSSSSAISSLSDDDSLSFSDESSNFDDEAYHERNIIDDSDDDKAMLIHHRIKRASLKGCDVTTSNNQEKNNKKCDSSILKKGSSTITANDDKQVGNHDVPPVVYENVIFDTDHMRNPCILLSPSEGVTRTNYCNQDKQKEEEVQKFVTENILKNNKHQSSVLDSTMATKLHLIRAMELLNESSSKKVNQEQEQQDGSRSTLRSLLNISHQKSSLSDLFQTKTSRAA